MAGHHFLGEGCLLRQSRLIDLSFILSHALDSEKQHIVQSEQTRTCKTSPRWKDTHFELDFQNYPSFCAQPDMQLRI